MSLARLLAPASIAVVGGAAAEGVIEQCRRLGFEGAIWPVHPTRATVGGLPAFRSVADLPAAPDAAFIGIPAAPTIDVVGALAALGCGGAVCHASGFGETGDEGRALQDRLRAAAGSMPVVGPNCMGIIDYVSGAAVWPDQQGGERIEGAGVAIVTQSGNIALNLSMQRRGLPVATLIAVGNGAVTPLTDLVEALIDSERITAVGLHLEQVPPIDRLLPVARRAAAAGKPLIVLRTGRSGHGARVGATHTGALAGDDAVAAAVLRRCGIAEVDDVPGFLETLLLGHVVGALPEASIVSASCSGGEAALVADLAEACDVALPALTDADRERLGAVLGERVTLDNPLDYHTYVWGDRDGLGRLFDAVHRVSAGLRVLVLDQPDPDSCDPASWQVALDAWCAAAATHGRPAAVLSSMAEGMPSQSARALVAAGVAPLRGIRHALTAVRALAFVGAARDRLLADASADRPETPEPLSATDGAAWLRAAGVRAPRWVRVPIEQAAERVDGLRMPVVVKTAAPLLHKSEVGGVVLGLREAAAVAAAASGMAHLDPEVIIEEMIDAGVAEILVGVRHDPAHGTLVTVGAGGVTTELSADAVTLAGPLTREIVHEALQRLRCWPLLTGFRGRPAGDVDAIVDAVLALAAGLEATPGLREAEVNPLIVLPDGVVAVDIVLVADPAPDRLLEETTHV